MSEDMPFDAQPARQANYHSGDESPFDAAPMGGSAAASPHSFNSGSTSSTLPPPPTQSSAAMKWDAQECLQDLEGQDQDQDAAPAAYDPIASAKMFEREKMAASTKPASSSLLSKVAAAATKATSGRPPVTANNGASSAGAYAFKRSESYDTAELIRKYGKYSQAAQAPKPAVVTPTAAAGAASAQSMAHSNSTAGAGGDGANIRSQALKVLDLVDDRWQKPVDVRRTESGGFRSSYSMQRTLSNASNSSGRHVPAALSGLGMAAGEASLSMSSPHDHNGGEQVGPRRAAPQVTFGGVRYQSDDEVEDDIVISDDAPLVDVVQMENRAAGRFTNNHNHNAPESHFANEDISDHDSEESDESAARKASWSSRYLHMPKSNDPRLTKMLDSMDREHNRGATTRMSARNMFAASAHDAVNSPVKGNGRVFGAGFSFRNAGLRPYRDMDDDGGAEDRRNLNASVYRDIENDGDFEDQEPPIHKTWQATQQKRRRRRYILAMLLCLIGLAIIIGTLASLLSRGNGDKSNNSAVAANTNSDNNIVPDEPSQDDTQSENIIENEEGDDEEEPTEPTDDEPTDDESTDGESEEIVDLGTSFFVTSDVPIDIDARVKLSKDLEALDSTKGEFLIHLGNMQDASGNCPAEQYSDVSTILAGDSGVPVFVIPGSKDWAHCPLPQASLEHWMEEFENFDDNFDFQTPFRLNTRPENFIMVHDGVLFFGAHLVNDDPNAVERQTDILTFYFGMLNKLRELKREFRAMVIFGNAKPSPEHQAFFDGVGASLRPIGVPVAYVHSNYDSNHSVLKYQPFDNMPSMLAIEIENGGKTAPLTITVARDLVTADEVFAITQ